MKKRFQLFALSVLCVAFARAQYVAPSEGVFRIINVGYNAALMENFLTHKLFCTAIGDNDDYEQLWILKEEGTGYSLQNVLTGAYIQTGNTGTEVNYWTGAAAKQFNIVAAGNENAYNIFDPTLGSQGLHSKGANGNVVRWVDCDPSRWKFVKVELTDADITAAREEYARLTGGDNLDDYQAVLDEVFADKACTVLSEAYASKTAEEIETALTGKLPAELVAMVKKIKDNTWAEPNEKADKPGWDANYAKKFRVQMIEPHSVAGEITEWLGINAHSNMDNPTGIYANKKDAVYVLVEGKIKEGSELWFNTLTGHNIDGNHARGIQLHEGLNVVPTMEDGSAIYLDYIVHTYDPSTKKFPHKLSEYSKLKVHIVGGYINSYYNVYGDELYTADTDTDWMYYEERANLEIIDVVGRYQILHFELNDVTITTEDKKTGESKTDTYDGLAKLFPERLPQKLPENQRINAIAEGWDRIMLSQMMAFGVAKKEVVDSMNIIYPRWDATWTEKAEIFDYEGYADFCEGRDYSEYFNHHGIAYGTRSGFMSAGGRWCNYHINTTPDILVNLVTGGDAWGPAHEIGHQHQSIFTLNGEMEVTNNFFANVSNWYIGLKTSRVAETQGNLENVYNNFKAGGNLYGNNIWALTQRYFRLWLYYHRVGHNTQFYPRLFELLRQNPMQRTNGSGGSIPQYDEEEKVWKDVGFGYTDGKNSLLHFYKLCCEAAQEDLTEFFRAYGYFTPMTDVFVGDYSNSMYNQTQKDIDRAIAEVKAKGYPVNNKVLFINDCTADKTYRHDGKTPRDFFDSHTAKGLNGEVGLYVDYLKGTPITGEYVYSLVKLKLTIEGGKGAVGFAVYDKEGVIRAFSNNHEFSLNNETANMLRSGEATLYAVTAEGEDVVVINKALQGTPAQQLDKLKSALKIAKEYLERTDTTGTKIGYLIPDSIGEYVSLVAKIDSVIEFADTTEYKYGEWYINLDAATAGIQANSAARIPLTPNVFYSISISTNANRYLDNANAGLKTTLEENAEILPYNIQWKFVEAETEGTFYIQHRESGNYISSMTSGKRTEAKSTDIKDAIIFTLVSADAPGEVFIQCADNEKIRMYNVSSNNQAWAGNQTGSNAKWTLRLADSMTALPETSTSEQITIYYLSREDNGEYAYSYLAKSRDKGRIATDMSNDSEDFNYWFYFKQGNQEGKYAVYNYGTGNPVTEKDGKLYIDKEAESAPEFTIAPNEQGTGLVISAEAGDWYMNMGNTTELVEINAEGHTAWKLQRVRTISLINEPIASLTINKAEATLIEGDSIMLTVETAPIYATDHSVTWSSSDTEVATVDSTGKVKAVAAGSAIITATANDDSGLTATCKLTVQKKESGIFTTETTVLSVQSVGGAIIIDGLIAGTEVSVYDVAGRLITTFTANESTATIDTGLVKKGTVIIKVGEHRIKVSL